MINALNAVETAVEKMKLEIGDKLVLQGEAIQIIRSQITSLESFLGDIRTHAKDYETFKVHLLPEDVCVPEVLNDPTCKIGSGAFGDVYKSKLSGSQVAVKMCSKLEKEEEFSKEIKILRSLQHDNIVAYRGSGLYNQRQFVVMEFLELNLHTHIFSRPSGDGRGLSAFITWHIMQQVGNALSYLHSRNMAHRDVKSKNILLDMSPIYPKPKLCDFGSTPQEYHQKSVRDVRHNSPEEETDFESAKRRDRFAFGLAVLETRTGIRPYGDIDTKDLSNRNNLNEVKEPNTSQPYWKIGEIKVSEERVSGEIGELILDCCIVSREKSFEYVMLTYFNKENPFKEDEAGGEFFSCGFLTNTNIFVADSLVLEEGEAAETKPTYQREDLICFVDLKPKMALYEPKEKELNSKFFELLKKYKAQAKAGLIDDNPILALKGLAVNRPGIAETQRITLKFIKSTYCHHRAMREIWRGFDDVEKNKLITDKQIVNKFFSTSFGLHVAVLTNEGEGKRKFVFSQRSEREGVAAPGAITCGAVESCSVNDFTRQWEKKDLTAHVSLIKTAARGLREELGLSLSEEDTKAIHLNTTYLKFDNHEWGMCGFIDLTDPRVCAENQLNFDRLNTAFATGSRDKFEHSRLHGVDFQLEPMIEWIREHHLQMASSGKIAVVKVLQAHFGINNVTKEFASYM